MSSECSADLNRVCDSGDNGEPCNSCVAENAYWRSQRYGKRGYSESEIRDAYSDPTEQSKRDILLAGMGE